MDIKCFSRHLHNLHNNELCRVSNNAPTQYVNLPGSEQGRHNSTWHRVCIREGLNLHVCGSLVHYVSVNTHCKCMCCKQSCVCLCWRFLCTLCVGWRGVCVCVCAVTEMYDTMLCLSIVSDRAATEGSKYFELGRQPHEFFNMKYLFL